MMGRKRKPPLNLILVILMLILLPLLAAKQYEWLGKVSQSDREQMQASMLRSASQFRDDFDREISHVRESFQPRRGIDVGPEQLKEQLRSDYATLFSRWVQTAPAAKLIGDLFLIVRTSEDTLTVERFNPAASKFERTEWPDEMNALRSYFRNITFKISPGTALDQVLNLPGSQIDPRIPAVIISIMGAPNENIQRIEFHQAPAIVVVKLNLDYIQKELIPALVRQDLSPGDGNPDYNVSVIDVTEPRRVIYSNGRSAKTDLKGDAIAGILNSSPIDRAIPRGRMVVVGSASDVERQESHGGTFQFEIQRSIARTPAVIPGVFPPGETAPWMLVVQHHSGSVAAAVAQTRERNLAISFSILILLGLSIGLILTSAQRERRLARQQMEFVSAVSHELRTPLSVICSAGENLADGVVRDDDQMKQYGALVRNEGRRLADMVEQILDFAGIQSGRKATKLEPTDVADVVDRALETFAMQIRDTGVVVEKRIAAGLPQIMADSPALVRALQNLISNALKYGESGNWLAVRAEASGESINIVVEDHGDGISAADLPHIFEPFYRGRSAVEAQIKGSGLGLSLVQQIVELHHAKITVNSDPESGSSFTIALPLRGSLANFVGSHDQAYSSR